MSGPKLFQHHLAQLRGAETSAVANLNPMVSNGDAGQYAAGFPRHYCHATSS